MRNSTGNPPSVSLSVPEILFFQEDCPNKGSLSYTRKKISFNSLFLERFAKIFILLNNLRRLILKTVSGDCFNMYQKIFQWLILHEKKELTVRGDWSDGVYCNRGGVIKNLEGRCFCPKAAMGMVSLGSLLCKTGKGRIHVSCQINFTHVLKCISGM